MPKVILKFNLPEEQQEFQDAMNGGKLAAAINEIHNEIFRPARKHGYHDRRLQKLIENNPDAVEIIELLEEKFLNILEDYKE